MLYFTAARHEFISLVRKSSYNGVMTKEALNALYDWLEERSETEDIDVGDLDALFSEYSEDALSALQEDLTDVDAADFEDDEEGLKQALIESLENKTLIISILDCATGEPDWNVRVLYATF